MSATRRFRRSIVLAALSLFSLPAHSIAQTYTVTDLGTLSGNLVSKAYALNNAGVAAGTSSDPTAAIAVMFSGGQATSISTLQASVSVATAINGSGQIVGWNSFDSNPNFDPQAFLYSTGSMMNINSPSLFPSGTEASGINSLGAVVGTGYLTAANFHA